MKLKVVFLSFVVTFVLSFLILLPDFISKNTKTFLTEVQRELKIRTINFSYGDVESHLLPLSVTVKDLEFTTYKNEKIVNVQQVSLSKWSVANLFELLQGDLELEELSRLHLAIQGIDVSEELLPDQVTGLVSGLGYEDFLFNFTADYFYEKQTKQLNLKELSLECPKVAKLNVALLLNEFDINDVMQGTFTNIAVENLKVEFKDMSLIKRYKSFISKTFAVDPMKTLAFLKTPGEAQKNKVIQRDPANVDIEAKIKDSLYAFLENPDTYKIKVAPDKALSYKDISIMLMLSPERLSSALNLQFEVNGEKFE